jgi:hypothetical protein
LSTIVECEDLDEVMKIARDIPLEDDKAVEIRRAMLREAAAIVAEIPQSPGRRRGIAAESATAPAFAGGGPPKFSCKLR